jgi:ferrous iron transport protein A
MDILFFQARNQPAGAPGEQSNLNSGWLTRGFARSILKVKMQVSFNKRAAGKRRQRRPQPLTLVELNEGEQGIIDRLDVPEDVAVRLMELGFVPGHVVTRGRSAPGGDPRVFQVDGSEIALRREMAARLILRVGPSSSC